MSRLKNALVDEIVQNCLNLYNKLPVNGKPVDNEWTVVSCVVQLEAGSGAHEPAALGTGSKCVGAGSMVASGVVLNDSHAEVCARRAFLLYLYDNIQYATENKPSIFKRDGNRFCLKENIQFIFYSSQLPCGDASILTKNSDEELFGDLLISHKRPYCEDVCDGACKRVKVDADVHRTGAKCLPDSVQDPKLPGSEYHLLGQVRTKPGRGDRTLSVSCSDKMARWAHVGVQGALLDMLCGPIYIKHFIFGGGVPYSDESLNRAFLNRRGNSTWKSTIDNGPQFYQSTLIFPHIRTDVNLRPAPGSIIWARTSGTSEVAVQGKKLGLTKKQAGLAKYSVCISKYKLYEKFLKSLLENEDIKKDILKKSLLKDVPYNDMKKKSDRYNNSWLEIKEKLFGSWTVKPDIWDFCVNVT